MNITIDEFKKAELKVVKVLSAEPVEGSEKLLKLQVDAGSEQRQILSGIAKYYKPEDLVGRSIVIISNLEPRQMMGLESQGMVLAAGDGETVSLLMPDKEIAAGAAIK
ncbi:MAG TPA: methionine--tRNA ligase subunit beta [Candidatus Paceibacterota bacterium]|nr:methionine--tRNA ligase subunit beta [Candidatus Paceibacterota bacterium]